MSFSVLLHLAIVKLLITCFFFTYFFPESEVPKFTPFGFSVEPADILVVRGGPALLNCSIDSPIAARIEWKKDGSFLSLQADERRSLLEDGSLFISSVVHSKHNKPDEGVYQCVASIQNLGTVSSRTARLSVAGKKSLAYA